MWPIVFKADRIRILVHSLVNPLVSAEMANLPAASSDTSPSSSDNGSPRSFLDTKHDYYQDMDKDPNKTPFTSPGMSQIQEDTDLMSMVSSDYWIPKA